MWLLSSDPDTVHRFLLQKPVGLKYIISAYRAQVNKNLDSGYYTKTSTADITGGTPDRKVLSIRYVFFFSHSDAGDIK